MKISLLTLSFALLMSWGLHAISLDESIAMAKMNNKSLLMAMEDVKKAEQTYNDVRGSLLPQLSLQGAYGLSKTYYPDSSIPEKVSFSDGLDDTATDNDEYLTGVIESVVNSMIPSSPAPQGSFALQLKMDQVLFLGGKLINGIKAVDRFRSIQKLRYKMQEQEVVLSTTQSLLPMYAGQETVGRAKGRPGDSQPPSAKGWNSFKAKARFRSLMCCVPDWKWPSYNRRFYRQRTCSASLWRHSASKLAPRMCL